jgi:hypothetical protein
MSERVQKPVVVDPEAWAAAQVDAVAEGWRNRRGRSAGGGRCEGSF